MSDIKPIRTKEDHEASLAELLRLLEKNPSKGTDEDVKIHVLTALIEEYENSTLPDIESDPIESIKLRLEQLGLKDKDLAQYLGSASRVSEILSGKRPLTVSMIKNLEDGLGISASLLVGSAAEKKNKRWSTKTLKTMARRGYFGDENVDLAPESILKMGLLRNVFNPSLSPIPSLLRQSNYRDVSNVDRFHMDAWSNKVIQLGMDEINRSNLPKFNQSKINHEIIGNLFKLSTETDGPVKVINELKTLGIMVVIEPELPNTKLDGATFFTETNPIIGLTLRLSRLDNYWFTLAHELSHILLHNDSRHTAFLDRLFGGGEIVSLAEKEADDLAASLLIPDDEWRKSPLRFASTPMLVKKFADNIGVHESVVAGRIRHDTANWMILSGSVNEIDVKDLFGDVRW